LLAFLAACRAADPAVRDPRPHADADTDADADSDLPYESPWHDGGIDPLPAFDDLLPLPGGAAGVPVFTSNNPETFTSTGFLYQCARTDPLRGGDSWPLEGHFAVYLHHHVDRPGTTVLQLLVTNPGNAELVVSGAGSAFTNGELPLARGTGPDYAVAEDLVAETPRTEVPPTPIEPLTGAAVWSASLGDGQYVDGRFALHTSAPAFVYLVAADTADPNEAIALSQTAATGDVHPPGDPPPPYGREAGVYAADTWLAAWTLAVPAASWAGYALDTALGTGFPQDQAFAALSAFDDSSRESVGNYGDVYDLAVTFEAGPAAASQVEVWLVSYGGVGPTFWLNGPVWVDGVVSPLWLAPDEPAQRIATVAVPGSIHVKLPIPGLASIPFGLVVVAP
jgi:hypothetical protein